MTVGKTGKSLDFEINESDVKVSIVSFEQKAAYVEIVVALQSYLINSADLVKAQYSIDGGVNWVDMSEYSGSCGKTALGCNNVGKQHSFYWDAVADIGIETEFTNVKVRFSAIDNSGNECDAAVSEIQTVDHRPPGPSVMNPSAGIFQYDATPDIIFLPPPVRRACYFHFIIEIDEDPLFGSPTTINSKESQIGWYYDDSGWNAYPIVGLNSDTYPENKVKHIVQSELTLQEYHVRLTNIVQHINRMCGETGAYCGDGSICGTPTST